MAPEPGGIVIDDPVRERKYVPGVAMGTVVNMIRDIQSMTGIARF